MRRFLTTGGIAGLATIIAVSIILGGFVLAQRGGNGDPSDPSRLEPVRAVGSAIPGPAPLILTEEEVARAEEVFANDPKAKALLAGRPYTIGKVMLWSTGAREKIGVQMDIIFPGQIVIKGEWPGIRYGETEGSTKPYEEAIIKATVRVAKLEVLVDLVRGRVVNINPGGDGEVIDFTPPDGIAPPSPLPPPD